MDLYNLEEQALDNVAIIEMYRGMGDRGEEHNGW